MRLQHHISKAAILLRSALFRVQASEAYKAIGNTRAWTSLTLVVLHRKRQSESLCETESLDSFFVREMTHWD